VQRHSYYLPVKEKKKSSLTAELDPNHTQNNAEIDSFKNEVINITTGWFHIVNRVIDSYWLAYDALQYLTDSFQCTQKSNSTMEENQELDRQKIEASINDYVTHWNNNDMDSWGTLFTNDADYINRNGGWWKNNKDNIEGHKQIHKMLIESGQPKSFSLEVKKVDFLKPDLAVVQVLSEWPGFKSYNNQSKENIKGIITCVFVKIDSKWLIKTLHNTLIDTPHNQDTNEDFEGEYISRKIKDALIKADISGDWNDFLGMMDEDVTFTVTIAEGTPISGVFRGKQRVVEYFESILPSVASFSQNKPIEFITDQNKIIALGDDTYTVVKNNKSQRSPYAIVIDLENDKINNILIIQNLSGIHKAYMSD